MTQDLRLNTSCDLATLTWRKIAPLEIRLIVAREKLNLPVTAAESRLATEWCEDFLACAGIGLVSRENYKIVERFEAGLPCSLGELEAVLFDYYSGPIAEYFPRARELA